MCRLMATPTQIEQVAERTERLLERFREMQRANQLLAEQLATLTHERDSLKSRLGAARARIDALLERLPQVGQPPAIRPAPRKDAE